MRVLAAEGLVDVLLLDLKGLGFTRWVEMMPRLVEAGVAASPHAWGCVLRTYYVAQLAAGVGNIPTIEGVPGTTDGVDFGAYRFADGEMTVGDAPGFGLKLVD